MSRCVCCDKMLIRTTGKRKLQDGSRVEETFCYECRAAIKYYYYANEYENESDLDDIFTNLVYGGVTPPKSSQY